MQRPVNVENVPFKMAPARNKDEPYALNNAGFSQPMNFENLPFKATQLTPVVNKNEVPRQNNMPFAQPMSFVNPPFKNTQLTPATNNEEQFRQNMPVFPAINFDNTPFKMRNNDEQFKQIKPVFHQPLNQFNKSEIISFPSQMKMVDSNQVVFQSIFC